MVARGVAHVFQIVVFAACAQTTLGTDRAHVGTGFASEKYILELHHTRVGKQQGRIVARDQRAGGNRGVTMAAKIIEEALTNFAAFHLDSRESMEFGYFIPDTA